MARCTCPEDVDSVGDDRLCSRCRSLLCGTVVNVMVNASDPAAAGEAVRRELSRISSHRGIGR